MIFWEDTDPKGITAKCEYHEGTYTVTVSKGDKVYSEKFGQTFTPTFGMDMADTVQAAEIAEKLAVKIEQELGI